MTGKADELMRVIVRVREIAEQCLRSLFRILWAKGKAVLTLLVVTGVIFAGLWSPQELTGTVPFLFIMLGGPALVGLLIHKWLLSRPVYFFFCWFPTLLAFLFGFMFVLGKAVGPLLSHGGGPTFEEEVYGFVLYLILVFSIFSVALVLLLTARVGWGLLTSYPGNLIHALSIVLQSYLALIMSMSIVYLFLDINSSGRDFGMYVLETKTDVQKRVEPPFSLEVDALYFSISTAATVGYGDIHPHSLRSKMAVGFQILASQFVLLVMLGTVVSRLGSPPGKGT